MRSGVRDAAKALSAGRGDEAAALLWNAIEPARLANDRRALAAIEELAQALTRDEAMRREGEKLLDAVRAAAGVEGAVPAEAVGTAVQGDESVEAPPAEAADLPEGTPGRGISLGGIVWLLIVVGVIVLNLIGQGRG